MKPIILAALLGSISSIAYAEADIGKCMTFGSVYESVAGIRDMGIPPEKSLEMIDGYSTVPLEAKKKIINEVYFDNRFAYSGGHALRNQIIDLCANGPKNWKPLK